MTVATARREPVFLLAPARSYSTVTLALLAGHPEIYGFPEMLAFAEPTVGHLLGKAAAPDRMSAGWAGSQVTGACRAIADLHEGNQSGEALARARAWLAERAGWSGARVLEHLLELAHPRVGLEKSPDTTRTQEAFDRCLRHFPDARLIHLTRHPVTTQQSMREHWRPFFTSELHLSVAAASAWYLSHRRITAVLSGLPPQRWMRVRAEDVLRAPERWLPRILGWLGLDHDERTVDRMLRTETWRFAGGMHGGDPKFMRDPRLRPVPEPGPVVFDPAAGLSDGMVAGMTSLARKLGY